MVVSPLGEILPGPQIDGEAILHAAIDLGQIAKPSTTSMWSDTTPAPTSSACTSTATNRFLRQLATLGVANCRKNER